MPKKSYYAVQSGRNTGIYETWDECKANVNGYSGATYKKFDNPSDAASFVRSSGYGSHTSSSGGGGGGGGGGGVRGGGGGSSSDYFTSSYAPSYATSYTSSYTPAPPPVKPDHHVYVDGAAPGNGREGSRAGWGVYHDDQNYQHLNKSERLQGDNQTNQRAELRGAIQGIRDTPHDRTPVIHTDSRYTMGMKDWLPNWETNGFKNAHGQPVANQDLVRDLDREIKARNGNVKWQHVPGHSGNPGNDMADRLAVHGASKPRQYHSLHRQPVFDMRPLYALPARPSTAIRWKDRCKKNAAAPQPIFPMRAAHGLAARPSITIRGKARSTQNAAPQ